MAKQSVENTHNLSKRIYTRLALLDYTRLINVNTADIDQLYKQIDYLNEHYADDERSMEFAIEHESEKLSASANLSPEEQQQQKRERLKQRLEEIKVQVAEKIFSYYQLDNTPQTAKLIENILTEGGVGSKEAKLHAQAICAHRLEEPFGDERLADRLCKVLCQGQKKLKEALMKDYGTYKDTAQTSALLADLEPNIVSYVLEAGGRKQEWKYSTYPAPRDPQKNPKQKEKHDKALANRDKIRDDFRKDGGVRKNFVRICGLLALNGRNFCQDSKNSAPVSNYETFCKHIKSTFGAENYPAVLDKALGISPKIDNEADREKARKARYQALSEEFYNKLMAGILSNKLRYTIEKNQEITWSVYLDTINTKFIPALCRGETDVGALAFVQPDATKSEDETAEKQVVSVHHKLPVGSAYDMIDSLCGPLMSYQKEQECCDLVNQIGNLALIIGKDMHQSLEAFGQYILKSQPDSMIFASRIRQDIFKLPIPKKLKDGMRKYINNGASFVTVSMPFPESARHTAERAKLQDTQTLMPIEQRFALYFGKLWDLDKVRNS